MSDVAKLPNGDKAVIDLRKLTDYVLNPDHRLGRHKARVFVAALGLTAEHAEVFQRMLAEAAATSLATLWRKDVHGAHYSIECAMEFEGRRALVRSLWMIRAAEDYPRLVTAFVAKKDGASD